MRSKPLPAVSEIQRVLRYDASSGHLYWIIRSRGVPTHGENAGCATPAGYRVVTLFRVRRYAHRIAWALYYGKDSSMYIDHIDGDKGNNRISNLREATPTGNAQNQRAAQRNNRSALLGAHHNTATGKWTSRIRSLTGRVFLGYFDTPEEAHEAYLRAKRELHSMCTI